MSPSQRVYLMLILIGSGILSIAEEALASTPVADVEIDSNGNVPGRLLDHSRGSGTELSLYREGRLIAVGSTDRNGTFQFLGLAAGTYHVQWTDAIGGRKSQVFRLWSHRQSPPIAEQQLLLSGTVVRGQYGGTTRSGGSGSSGGMGRFFRNPWISAAVISTAIAVPIAVTYGDYDAS